MTYFSKETYFEDEVRRVARFIWPQAMHSGSIMAEGRERDGFFETDENVHIIECTVSNTKEKAQQDVKKLRALIPTVRKTKPTKAVKGWFITLNEPTVHQRAVVEATKGDVVCMSFSQFQSKLVNGREYLALRGKCPFGSVRNPSTGEQDDPHEYVHMDIVSGSGDEYSIIGISSKLQDGGHVVLLGDYGAGKSRTLKEVFQELAREFCANSSSRFPVFLNLRDHHGQKDIAEALERHARNVGFEPPGHLVRAWRAGYVVLLLDGFDELGAAGWTGKGRRLRDLRYQALTLIRHFFDERPSGVGIAISGRRHFFDSVEELANSLGAPAGSLHVSVNDFTESQVTTYLQRAGWAGSIPAWFPSRPLLLGYLAARKMLPVSPPESAVLTPAEGWDMLLNRISERESKIEIGIDGGTVRQIIERLASRARGFVDGLGPLQQQDLVNSFKEICLYEPDDKGLVLLQRLPGLGPASSEDGSRIFIDKDLADVARAGDVCRFVHHPYDIEESAHTEWQCALGWLGRDVGASKCREAKYSAKKMSAAMVAASKMDNADCLMTDIYQIMGQLGLGYQGPAIEIDGVCIDGLALDANSGGFASVRFRDCLIQRVELDLTLASAHAPRFACCCIGVIEGPVSESDIPRDIFDRDCTFDSFDASSRTTSAIMESTLQLPVKVMLTILRKLYLQAGAGRRSNALMRGLDHKARRFVDDVLKVLRQEGLVIKNQSASDVVWLPVRNQSARVRKLVFAPTLSRDPLISKVMNV